MYNIWQPMLQSQLKLVEWSPKQDDQIANSQEVANGRSDFKSHLINDQKDLEKANYVLIDTKMEYGSNSQCYYENMANDWKQRWNSSAWTYYGTKISKLKVTEFDHERILEEQDTHDLYCPRCNSCITKGNGQLEEFNMMCHQRKCINNYMVLWILNLFQVDKFNWSTRTRCIHVFITCQLFQSNRFAPVNSASVCI